MSDTTKKKVAKLDLTLRHKSGMTSDKFIEEYCKIFRNYAYATRDDSLNEFEKEITHVLGMLIYYKRFCEIMGFVGEDGDFKSFDPRDFVQEYEDAMEARVQRFREITNRLLDNARKEAGIAEGKAGGA